MSTIEDVTGPAAASRAQEPPELWAALKALGFGVVGQVESVGGNLRLCNHVLHSPDRRTFAMPEQPPGKKPPVLYFRSILRDGSILDTAGRPQIHPLLIAPPRLSQPVSGYRCQRFPGADPQRLFAEHTAALDDLERQRSSSAVPADSVATYLVLSRRVFRLAQLRTFVSLGVMSILGLAPIVLVMSQDGYADAGRLARGAVMAVIGLWIVVINSLAAHVAARLPVGPARVPFEELRSRHGEAAT